MENQRNMKLIGGLRIGSSSDESFYDNLLSRLPKEVKNTGDITRYVAFDYLSDNENSITFLGIEVDKIEIIPNGMIAWVLDDQNFIVLKQENDENRVIWREELQWKWIKESPSRYHRGLTGEFLVQVPPEWTGTAESDLRFFTMTVNMYTAPGQTNHSDSIQLVEYEPSWPEKFAKFSESLYELLGSDIALKIEHHGSTSIPGMIAKPIIDILVIVPSFSEARQRVIPLLNDPEWEYVWYHNHMALVKRDKFMGKRTHHVHMMPECKMFKRYLAFRDYLRAHPEAASRYAALKRKLAAKHRDDREQYTSAKAAFVNEIVELAMK